MNDLQVFNYEGNKVRTLEIEGEPWFVGKDIATLLGYENASKAIRDHVRDCHKMMGVQNVTPSVTDNVGRSQYPTWIDEAGLYSLILSSKLPSAEDFQEWVTSEVLPSLRKTGAYSMSRATTPSMSDKMVVVETAARMLNMNDSSKILMLQNFCKQEGIENTFLPKYEDNGGHLQVSATDLLKKYGLNMSAQAFNKLLLANGYLVERERTGSKGETKKFKMLTEKGLKYGENQISPHNPREVQPLYYEDTFKELFDLVVSA